MPPRRSASVGRLSRLPPSSTSRVQHTTSYRQPSVTPRSYSTRSSIMRVNEKSKTHAHQDQVDMVVCPEFGTNGNLAKKSIRSFQRLVIPSNIKSLDLSDNLITDFYGFNPSENLESLNLTRNPIKNLKGFPNLMQSSHSNPKSGILRNVKMAGTPFSKNAFYRIALIILVGESNIRIIDGERVTASERKIAASYPIECSNLLRVGWQISYPPPSKADLIQIRAKIAEDFRNEPNTSFKPATARNKASLTKSPMIKRKAKPQSKLYEESLKQQENEIDELAKEIERFESELESNQQD